MYLVHLFVCGFWVCGTWGDKRREGTCVKTKKGHAPCSIQDKETPRTRPRRRRPPPPPPALPPAADTAAAAALAGRSRPQSPPTLLGPYCCCCRCVCVCVCVCIINERRKYTHTPLPSPSFLLPPSSPNPLHPHPPPTPTPRIYGYSFTHFSSSTAAGTSRPDSCATMARRLGTKGARGECGCRTARRAWTQPWRSLLVWFVCLFVFLKGGLCGVCDCV